MQSWGGGVFFLIKEEKSKKLNSVGNASKNSKIAAKRNVAAQYEVRQLTSTSTPKQTMGRTRCVLCGEKYAEFGAASSREEVSCERYFDERSSWGGGCVSLTTHNERGEPTNSKGGGVSFFLSDVTSSILGTKKKTIRGWKGRREGRGDGGGVVNNTSARMRSKKQKLVPEKREKKL